MDDASLEQACVEILENQEPRQGRGRAAQVVAPSVERQVRAVVAKNARLFRDARLDAADVSQEVLRRLIESPPNNPEGRDPVAVVLGWARAVANNMALDGRRHAVREIAPRESRDEEADAERPAEEVLLVLSEIDRMHAESQHLASYKYLRETFQVLVKDPDVSALELARKVGLIEATDSDPARTKKAAQYAWKLRQRMLDLLAARMGNES